MPPNQKKFVKYSFEDANNKPRQKEQRRPSRQNFMQKDTNTQTRKNKNVYTEKPSNKQNVLKDMINSFIPIKKPSPKIETLMKNFPKFFTSTPKEPELYVPESLNTYLTMGRRPIERQARHYAPLDPQSESDPDWDSDVDIEGGIESKKIKEEIFEKTIEKHGSFRQLRQDELRRHEKQFLEDYYRQKHQEQLENAKNNPTQNDKNKNSNSDQSPQKQEGSKQGTEPFNEWTDYQQKQVKDFVNMGFIQKIQEDQNDFADDDFSVEDQKSQSQKSVSSSEDEDDIFGDEGPTTIVKKKEITEENAEDKHANLGRVVINSHLFSRIAEMVGIPPGACIWIIRNKTHRYKVSTQFMDEMYRLNNFCESLPYVSLNHSQFVHNNDVQKEKGLQIFKKFNARKQHHNHHQGYTQQTGNGNGNKNYDNNKRKFQYKPNTVQNPKTHINKK